MSNWGEAAANTRKLIVDRAEFVILNLSASRPHVANRRSRMPQPWRYEYELDLPRIIYEVRSWNTPIAWYVEDEGWVFPPIGYTAYTSRHQGLVHRALRDADLPMRTVLRRENHLFNIEWDWEVSA